MTNVLKDTREKKGITISELARKAKVARQTIYNIEANPNASVSPEVMASIAQALGVKASTIFLI